MNCILDTYRLQGEVLANRIRSYNWIIVGIGVIVATTLILTGVGAFAPESVLDSCLINHNENTFQLFPRVEIIVDGEPKLLPAGIGITDGMAECIRPIHTDEVGNTVHVEHTRPFRSTMQDFMNIYSDDGKTITVIDNSTGILQEEAIELAKYHIDYYQVVIDTSVQPSEIAIPRDEIESYPPFSDNFTARLELTPIASTN